LGKILVVEALSQVLLKMRMVRCYVYSILLYGSESFEMWVYRRIGHISWKEKKTNKAVLEVLGIKQDLLNEVKTRQLKYFGHIKRHNFLLKSILEQCFSTRGDFPPRKGMEGPGKIYVKYVNLQHFCKIYCFVAFNNPSMHIVPCMAHTKFCHIITNK
jgi:hypothetical protein